MYARTHACTQNTKRQLRGARVRLVLINCWNARCADWKQQNRWKQETFLLFCSGCLRSKLLICRSGDGLFLPVPRARHLVFNPCSAAGSAVNTVTRWLKEHSVVLEEEENWLNKLNNQTLCFHQLHTVSLCLHVSSLWEQLVCSVMEKTYFF